MTGVVEYDLNKFLVKNGLSVLTQPLIVNATIGGMLATSTHVSIVSYCRRFHLLCIKFFNIDSTSYCLLTLSTGFSWLCICMCRFKFKINIKIAC